MDGLKLKMREDVRYRGKAARIWLGFVLGLVRLAVAHALVGRGWERFVLDDRDFPAGVATARADNRELA